MFIADLKTDHLIDIGDEKKEREKTVVDNKLSKRPLQSAHKRKPVPVGNIACDMEGHTEACRHNSHDKKTGKPDMIQILRVKKQVGDAQIFAE